MTPHRSCLVTLAALLAGCGGSTPSPDSSDAAPTCTTEAATAVSAHTRARVGAYFFDGWTGPLSNFHFDGLLSGEFSDRQPLTGWRDASSCVIEQQLATARAFGVDFFLFDWYFGAPGTAGGENLNSALQITHTLPDRHGMQYAILYVNADPFVIAAADWPSAVKEWVGYFQDPAYLRVNGKPLLSIIDSQKLRTTFGGSAGVRTKLDALRAAAQAAGLPGVYIVGGIVPPYDDQPNAYETRLIDAYVAEGYDAISMYNYPNTGNPNGAATLPFSALADGAHWLWREAASYSPLPFIPVVMAGWDSRPWNGTTTVWYSRTPADFGGLMADALDWADATPSLRAEPSPAAPLVLIEAWNELGEGGYFIPTMGEGRTYGDALASALAVPPPKTRTVLGVADSGPLSAPRAASGTLTDAAGAPIAGASVAVTATARDGNGLYADYTLVDQVPGNAAQAVVGFRVNYELLPPSTAAIASSFTLYQASYHEPDGVERVANSNFATGSTSWGVGYQTQIVASDRGAGSMASVQATSAQMAQLTSAAFDVTPGAMFTLDMAATVAPSAAGSGYFMIIFLDSGGGETARLWIPLAAGKSVVGTATTGAGGAYQVSLSSLGSANVTIEASSAGDGSHYPAHAVAP